MRGASGGPNDDEQLPGDRLLELVKAKAADLRASGLIQAELEDRLDAHARAMGSL